MQSTLNSSERLSVSYAGITPVMLAISELVAGVE